MEILQLEEHGAYNAAKTTRLVPRMLLRQSWRRRRADARDRVGCSGKTKRSPPRAGDIRYQPQTCAHTAQRTTHPTQIT
eukprot:1309777-Lingulodinium_polyedra.AAC.1